MKKKSIKAFGRKAYLLGQDINGTNYYLEEARWDCGWYWGGGYVVSYTNNRCPELSKDISSHQHFDHRVLRIGNAYDQFTNWFVKTPFERCEIWRIIELMKSFYVAREYSDMIYRGGTHFTTNPAQGVIVNGEEYDRINKEVIPAIMNELYAILGEDK